MHPWRSFHTAGTYTPDPRRDGFECQGDLGKITPGMTRRCAYSVPHNVPNSTFMDVPPNPFNSLGNNGTNGKTSLPKNYNRDFLYIFPSNIIEQPRGTSKTLQAGTLCDCEVFPAPFGKINDHLAGLISTGFFLKTVWHSITIYLNSCGKPRLLGWCCLA